MKTCGMQLPFTLLFNDVLVSCRACSEPTRAVTKQPGELAEWLKAHPC